MDTNDPQQMGRIRAVCAQWGDTWDTSSDAVPWAIYMSPFGGTQMVGTRGPELDSSEGNVSYGMWAIPKVGSQVAVMCVDGNPMTRMYIGCIFDQHTPHTLPHGRYVADPHPSIDPEISSDSPTGPLTSSEKPVQPLAKNMKQAFSNGMGNSIEYKTRGADYSVSRVDIAELYQTYSKVQDDQELKQKGWVQTQGYQLSRSNAHEDTTYTAKNYDSMVYSITSPGFHAFSMDDRQENCRVRIRSTAGHQILMDDTNERIYIATAKGNNWIEMDQAGNIDVFTSGRFNVHAARDINLTSDESVRIYGKNGVHIKSGAEIGIDAASDVSVISASNVRTRAGAGAYMESGGATNIKAGAATNIQAGGTLNLKAGGSIVGTGSTVDMNGGGAAAAAASGAKPAKWTNRVPTHEPFARCMTKDDYSHTPEFEYDSENNNQVERGIRITRGTFWRR